MLPKLLLAQNADRTDQAAYIISTATHTVHRLHHDHGNIYIQALGNGKVNEECAHLYRVWKNLPPSPIISTSDAVAPPEWLLCDRFVNMVATPSLTCLFHAVAPRFYAVEFEGTGTLETLRPVDPTNMRWLDNANKVYDQLLA